MSLADPQTLFEFLSRHGLSARKSLGQHYLCSEQVVEAILSRLEGISGILEIGPGPGVLTGPMSERSRLIALEIDSAMIAALRDSAPKAEVRRTDALRVELATILEQLPRPRAVVSNLPYYITAPLLEATAVAAPTLDRAILMMQREVADRVIAPAGDARRGSLSVYLQAIFSMERVIEVPADSFLPPPKVASTVLEFVPKVSEGVREDLFSFVRQGFEQPRKTLANNLSGPWARADVESALVACGLSATVRAHELGQEEWSLIAGEMASRPKKG